MLIKDSWEPESSDSDSDFDDNLPLQPILAVNTRRVNSYDVHDNGPPVHIPKFLPARKPGLHLREEMSTRDTVRQFLDPQDFFKLFFTLDLVETFVKYTNNYASTMGPTKPSIYSGWYDVSAEEFYKFLGLLMYMSIVQVPSVKKYWSTSTLYHGLWARAFLTRKRFIQIMTFLKVSNIETEIKEDKLCKVRLLSDFIRRKCQKLYQPRQQLSIDERMVKNKGRYTFRQYIRDKPTKWGMKVWVIVEAITGYTYDFDVYLGKQTQSSNNGLAYVVMNLIKSVKNQGYQVFFYNIYSGYKLLKDLLLLGILACGTILKNRKGFPNELKDIITYEKKSKRGDMRWIREDEVLTVQWRDNKTVSLVSNYMTANGFSFVNRRTKVDGVFKQLLVRQPNIVKSYNAFMCGVVKSDQLINKYNTLRRTINHLIL